MGFLDLSEQPLWIAGAIYVAAGVVVWIAGGKASRYADTISQRTGIGGAVIGMVLLGAMTSLPEIGTSATASLGGNAGMAVGNLVGSVSFQIVVLAVVDAFIGRQALTSTVFSPSILLQAIVSILLLALAVSGTIGGDFTVLGFGLWPAGMVAVYIASMLFVRRQERHGAWMPQTEERPLDEKEREREEAEPASDSAAGRGPLGTALILKTAGVAAVILVAGYVLTRSAESIAGQTGLENDFVGLTLLAAATSLPEFSTAIAAVKLGRNEMAMGDVLGGNMFNLVLIFLVDALYSGPPVMEEVGLAPTFAGVLGIVLTAIYLIGMIERRDRTVFRMGYDSLLVLLGYAGGVVLLYSLASA
jgi:cation:H+ antiporter